MNDSADIRVAADRLQTALKSLEQALSPLIDKVTHLETAAKEAENFEHDRVSLAAKLDAAKAKEETFKAREKEFSALADETTSELDRVIKHVKDILNTGQA